MFILLCMRSGEKFSIRSDKYDSIKEWAEENLRPEFFMSVGLDLAFQVHEVEFIQQITKEEAAQWDRFHRQELHYKTWRKRVGRNGRGRQYGL